MNEERLTEIVPIRFSKKTQRIMDTLIAQFPTIFQDRSTLLRGLLIREARLRGIIDKQGEIVWQKIQ